MNKEEIEIKYLGQDDIRDYIMKKDYQIYQLQQRIDKAIEKLDGCWLDYDGNLIDKDDNEFEIKDIIDILRGEE